MAEADVFNNDLSFVDEINDGCEDDEDDNGNDWDEEKENAVENEVTGDWCNLLRGTGNGCDDNSGCSGSGGDARCECTTIPWNIPFNGTNISIKNMLAIIINHDWRIIAVGPDINNELFDHLLPL